MKLKSQILSRVPLFGALIETSRHDRREALSELCLAQLISSMPIWLGVLVYAWPNLGLQKLYEGALDLVKTGELFIYASSTLAPVIYIVVRDRDIPRAFPSKYWYIGIAVFGAILSAAIFALQRKDRQVLTEEAILVSLVLFVVSVVTLYLALVYNNAFPPNPNNMRRKEEEDVTERLRLRKEGEEHGSN